MPKAKERDCLLGPSLKSKARSQAYVRTMFQKTSKDAAKGSELGRHEVMSRKVN